MGGGGDGERVFSRTNSFGSQDVGTVALYPPGCERGSSSGSRGVVTDHPSSDSGSGWQTAVVSSSAGYGKGCELTRIAVGIQLPLDWYPGGARGVLSSPDEPDDEREQKAGKQTCYGDTSDPASAESVCR